MTRHLLTVPIAACCFCLPLQSVAAGELGSEEEFSALFDGKSLAGWQGVQERAEEGYVVKDGVLICTPRGGAIFTVHEYADFHLKFEFKLQPGSNNGIGLRTPFENKDPAYAGMEIQILDDTAPGYQNLQPYQYHGSIYGVVSAKRGFLKPVGEWNEEEIICRGHHVVVKLNGQTIVDADIKKAATPKTIDGKDHPGLTRTKGHIALCGHGARVEFRNMRIKEWPNSKEMQH
ncbi:MAG: DUF1080 domain-containing protein [Pirellulales bacterium]|nr:DUF1080 domain-containing protein [Pirellulales bacterium]